ncbi:hypothetical protein N9A25_00195 [bacterium]|nr:hypothetical protein [bacterium]
MRLYEFNIGNDILVKFVLILKNEIGSAQERGAPVSLNWSALTQLAKDKNIRLKFDYETFKSLYDQSPILQKVVKNYNAKGIELNVPGAPDSQEPQQGDETSQDAVDQIAASAAPQQLAQQTA